MVAGAQLSADTLRLSGIAGLVTLKELFRQRQFGVLHFREGWLLDDNVFMGDSCCSCFLLSKNLPFFGRWSLMGKGARLFF